MTDVKREIIESEQRVLKVLHTEIEKLRNEVKTDREQSHMVLSKTISNFGSEVIAASRELREFIAKRGSDIDMLIMWKAVHEVEAKEINSKISEVLTTLSRVMWIVITGVVVALLGLILK